MNRKNQAWPPMQTPDVYLLHGSKSAEPMRQDASAAGLSAVGRRNPLEEEAEAEGYFSPAWGRQEREAPADRDGGMMLSKHREPAFLRRSFPCGGGEDTVCSGKCPVDARKQKSQSSCRRATVAWKSDRTTSVLPLSDGMTSSRGIGSITENGFYSVHSLAQAT